MVLSGAAGVNKRVCAHHPVIQPPFPQNVRPVNYGEDSTELFVNLTCLPDYVGRVEASCPGTNATVAMNCSGMYPTIDPLTGLALEFKNTWTTQMSCATTVQPTCLLWSSALQARRRRFACGVFALISSFPSSSHPSVIFIVSLLFLFSCSFCATFAR